MNGLDEYQKYARLTAQYPGQLTIGGLMYCPLGLGESGEVQNKVKKFYRKGAGPDEADQTEIAKELGDILWYVAMTAWELGYSLEEIAVMNIDKLNSRMERGVLEGNGDNR